jgi:hypothetical protein
MGQGLLLPGSPEAFQQLERAVRSCHAAAILVSDPSLRQIQENRGLARVALDILKARTDNLFALALTKESAAKLPEAVAAIIEPAIGWQPDAELSSPASLHDRFEAVAAADRERPKKQLPAGHRHVAMTADEAKQIDDAPTPRSEAIGAGGLSELSGNCGGTRLAA